MKEQYKSYFNYVVIGIALLFISIVIINIEAQLKTKYLMFVFIVFAISGLLILPNYYRAFWDKKYCQEYTPKKDLKKVILSLLGLFLIGSAITIQTYFNMLIFSLVLLILALVPIIYLIVLFVIDDINFSKQLKKKKNMFIWFASGIVLAIVILLIRYVVLNY